MEEYATLEQLEDLLSESGYICFGHGTGRSSNSDEVVSSIFKEGLRTKDNSLYFTTIGLTTPTKELKDQYKELGLPEPTMNDLKQQLNNWQHLNSNNIIIARLPIEYINNLGDRSDLDGEMYGAFYNQKTQENGKSTNYLDSKFIIGCFEVDKQRVKLNKNFEKNFSTETIKKMQENYKKALEKTKDRINRQTKIHDNELNEMIEDVQYNTDTYDEFTDLEWDDNYSK